MNSTPAKLGIFAVALAVIFASALFVGRGIGPSEATTRGEQSPGESMGPMDGSEGADHDDGGGTHGGHGGGAEAGEALPGLAVSSEGYSLVPVENRYQAGADQTFRFTIEGPDGHPVTDFEVQHEKDLHLIVVPRDLSSFQHLHPTRDAGGMWTAAADFSSGGTYRAYTDFKPAGHQAALTLGVDVAVAGEYRPQKLPVPNTVDTFDGYDVELSGSPTAGEAADLTFTVRRNGKEVTDLEPYLGAFGHLVTIRDGDLAYLHTHPHQEAKAGSSGGPAIMFNTTLPSSGSYRLFLNFQHNGRVQTAAFTVVIDDHGHPSSAPTASPTR